MGELTKSVIEKLKSAKSGEDLDGWVWQAADLMKKAHAGEYHSGFDDIDKEVVSPQEARELRGVLLDALTRSCEPLFVGPIIDALGCACDASLKQLYVQYLARYLRELKLANKVVYAALRALAEINEPVFEEGQGRSLADVDRNIREAQRYLEKHAIPIPW